MTEKDQTNIYMELPSPGLIPLIVGFIFGFAVGAVTILIIRLFW